MSTVRSEKARSAWLFSFGDVLTLLITFFIMMIVLNKGEITKVQRWSDIQLKMVYDGLADEMQSAQFVEIDYQLQGAMINVNNPNAFLKGGYEPSPAFEAELNRVGKRLRTMGLFKIQPSEMPVYVQNYMESDDLVWRPEIAIEGHTDSDAIDPNSALRNNWFLSTMRAQAVMQILFNASELDQSLFSMAGYGEFRPKVHNGSLQGKAQNRRVQILISATFEKASLAIEP